MAFSNRSRAFRARNGSAAVWDFAGCTSLDARGSVIGRAADLFRGKAGMSLDAWPVWSWSGPLLRPRMHPAALIRQLRRVGVPEKAVAVIGSLRLVVRSP